MKLRVVQVEPPVTVVVDAVVRDLCLPRIDKRVRIVAVEGADKAVAVLVAPFVHLPVAVLVHAVGADLVRAEVDRGSGVVAVVAAADLCFVAVAVHVALTAVRVAEVREAVAVVVDGIVAVRGPAAFHHSWIYRGLRIVAIDQAAFAALEGEAILVVVRARRLVVEPHVDHPGIVHVVGPCGPEDLLGRAGPGVHAWAVHRVVGDHLAEIVIAHLTRDKEGVFVHVAVLPVQGGARFDMDRRGPALHVAVRHGDGGVVEIAADPYLRTFVAPDRDIPP